MPIGKSRPKQEQAAPAQPTFSDSELEAQQQAVELGSATCPVMADDGEACRRAPHPDQPNDHQFSDAPIRPVDGGKRWSYWIGKVNTMRRVLVGYEFLLATDDGQKLTQLAKVLDLFVIPSDAKGMGIIADDAEATWQTYKEQSNG